ncbi:hypothetical protein FRC12_019047 [Ceratobasidium sp. 428]|nr:hypothetical protein FRC12_019047 [Ceratobasidium sp. 428]
MTALDDWKAMRKTLATTIRSYRNACIALSAVSWLPIHRTSEHTMLEDMFLAIDSELDSLAAEESTLYDTRMALATVRNKSTTLARVNSLPFEILARIFSFSKINCSHKEKEGNGLHNFTGVCTYWRQITINSADLWTHVDITPNTSTGWMNLLLERTKGIPMHLHFYEQRLGASKQPIPKRERLASIDMLRLHIHRVQDLELYSYRDSISEHAITVLSLWLTGGSPNLARSLSVFRPHARGFLDYGGQSEESKIINQSDNAKEMLRCLSVYDHADISTYTHTRFKSRTSHTQAKQLESHCSAGLAPPSAHTTTQFTVA